MNERIKELKLQAIKLVAESYPCDIEDFTDGIDERVRAKVDEKFADLIVRECADVANNKMKRLVDSIICEEQIDTEVFVGNKIKKHFGVER